MTSSAASRLAAAALLSAALLLTGCRSTADDAKNADLSPAAADESAEVAPTSPPAANADSATVTRVIDGDTIELSTGERVRYLLVDTPELNPAECFGREATEANRRLVEGRQVSLEIDKTNRDRYGRLLRYVSVEGTDVSAYLIANGYAYVYTYGTDTARLAGYAKLERAARESGLGLWSACPR